MKGYVYRYVSPSNKSYIGITTDEKRRKYHHKYYSYKNDTKFKKAINKYGFENFKYIILEIVEGDIEYVKNKLKYLEIEYINKFDSFKNGYNMSLGGDDSIFNVLSETGGLYGVGKVFKTTYGREFKILSKIGYNEREIIFEDGYILKVFIINIKKGTIKHKDDFKFKVGDILTTKDGGKIKILKLENATACIEFLNTKEIKNIDRSCLSRGNIQTKVSKYGIGTKHMSVDGFEFEIIKTLHNITNGKILIKFLDNEEERIIYTSYIRKNSVFYKSDEK